MNNKTIVTVLLLIVVGILLTTNAKKQKKMIENNFEYVDNDPLSARVYTLDNGLKVYMSVNTDDAPRIQTNIAVSTGSKQ